tara:strand:+ start:570 stop:1079 length:510 start_codon:yes stop_codon:yes gene_type:complete
MAIELISRVTTSAVSSVSFTNLSQTGTDLIVHISARSTTNQTVSDLQVKANNTSSNIYFYRGFYATGTGTVTGSFGNNYATEIGIPINGAYSDGNVFSTSILEIFDYSLGAPQSSYTLLSATENGSVANFNMMRTTGYFDLTVAITQLDFYTNFAAGSTISIYKRTAGN